MREKKTIFALLHVRISRLSFPLFQFLSIPKTCSNCKHKFSSSFSSQSRKSLTISLWASQILGFACEPSTQKLFCSVSKRVIHVRMYHNFRSERGAPGRYRGANNRENVVRVSGSSPLVQRFLWNSAPLLVRPDRTPDTMHLYARRIEQIMMKRVNRSKQNKFSLRFSRL